MCIPGKLKKFESGQKKSNTRLLEIDWLAKQLECCCCIATDAFGVGGLSAGMGTGDTSHKKSHVFH